METIRRYGKEPFSVVVVHGGPGAGGELAPVARELGKARGVLEPIQSATSLKGQVAELHAVLQDEANLPVTLIGHSWGAWLCYMVAAAFPDLVGRLILVSSGPFEEIYAAGIMERRLRRLHQVERAEAQSLLGLLNGTRTASQETFQRLAVLMEKADVFDPINEDPQPVIINPNIFQGVWPEAAAFRGGGQLLALGQKIRCPVVAIHGAEDAHPAEGVRAPLAGVLDAFEFHLLERCGHKPWIEKQTQKTFYDLLGKNL